MWMEDIGRRIAYHLGCVEKRASSFAVKKKAVEGLRDVLFEAGDALDIARLAHKVRRISLIACT